MTTFHAVCRKTVLVILSVAATTMIASSVSGSANSTWRTFTLASQRLSVSMPGTPKSKEVHTKSFIGSITTNEYYVDDDPDSYSIEFTDLPGFAVSFSGPDVIYDHAKGALLKETLSKVISFTDVTLNGVKGKRLVYDTPTKPGHPEMQGEARFFLSGDRLYSADAVVLMADGSEKLERFFSSLEIGN
jgi:hypothetical protein